jgi:multidrug efflux pump
VVVAKDVAARERLEVKLAQYLDEEVPQAVTRVSPLELGPPVGWPIQYRVLGDDLERLREIALELGQIVADHRGARDVNFDWMEPGRQVRIRIDQDQVRRLGLSSASVASVLNTHITGTTVTQVRDDIFLIDVVAREREGQRLSFSTLRTLEVPLPDGRTVPLNQVASFDYGQEYPMIWRRDRVPTLTVQADVLPGVLPDSVVADLTPAIEALIARLPAGYWIEVGGTVEESADSQASVMAVVPVMALIMISLLMFQLRSFPLLVIVLSVVPLGLIGVVGALLIAQAPLGFVAILGVLALIGMIAKNSVILIDQIEQERRTGKPLQEAVVDASASRLRPIMLTALSTVLGLIPIAPTVFWGPMARHHGGPAGGLAADPGLPPHPLRDLGIAAGGPRRDDGRASLGAPERRVQAARKYTPTIAGRRHPNKCLSVVLGIPAMARFANLLFMRSFAAARFPSWVGRGPA